MRLAAELFQRLPEQALVIAPEQIFHFTFQHDYATPNGYATALREAGLWRIPAQKRRTIRETPGTEVPGEGESAPAGFALEHQLEEFLLENWEHTPLGNEWDIFSTPEDPQAGEQYPTDVGPIDILAVHKKEQRFLVIELKRNQSTDQTVGQVLRYMGWIKKHLAKGQPVEGLIIARQPDKRAVYALSLLPTARMMAYEVEFRLKPLASLSE